MKVSKRQLRKIILQELAGGGGRPEMNRRSSTSWRSWVGGKVSEGDDEETTEIGDDERSEMGGEEEVTLESIDSDAFVKMILAEAASIRYSVGGLGDPNKLTTGQVEFNWGKYKGRLASEDYFILDGKSELGSVQNAGDPYTYEWSLEGLSPQFSRQRLVVLSAPESGRQAVGSRLSREQSLSISGEESGEEDMQTVASSDETEQGPQSARISDPSCDQKFPVSSEWTTERVMGEIVKLPVEKYLELFAVAAHDSSGYRISIKSKIFQPITSPEDWSIKSVSKCVSAGCAFGPLSDVIGATVNEINPSKSTVKQLMDSGFVNYYNIDYNPNLQTVWDAKLPGYTERYWKDTTRWNAFPWNSFPGPKHTIQALLGLLLVQDFIETGSLVLSDQTISYGCDSAEAKWRVLKELGFTESQIASGR